MRQPRSAAGPSRADGSVGRGKSANSVISWRSELAAVSESFSRTRRPGRQPVGRWHTVHPSGQGGPSGCLRQVLGTYETGTGDPCRPATGLRSTARRLEDVRIHVGNPFGPCDPSAAGWSLRSRAAVGWQRQALRLPADCCVRAGLPAWMGKIGQVAQWSERFAGTPKVPGSEPGLVS